MNFRKILTKDKIFSEYVRVMNGVFGLSKRETEVYSLLLRLNDTIKTSGLNKFKFNILNAENRRIIMRECNITKTNLSRQIMKFKEIGLIQYDNNTNTYEIPGYVAPTFVGGHTIEITFTLSTLPDEATGSDH
jgi:predicted transcriptional regulator